MEIIAVHERIEEVASRLIPGYVPTTQPLVASDEPPHQTPESNPLAQEQPQPTLAHDTTSQQEPSPENPTAASAIQSPPATPPVEHPEQTVDDDGDILMPSSSPPPGSPTPPISPQILATNDIPIDELENDSPTPPTDFLVPVSSPPAVPTGRGSSVGPRTPRRKRRSSFSQLSSSPPADEFTGARYEPLPASPSTAKMIQEREKELKAKEAELEKARNSAREKEINVNHDDRGSPPAAQKLRTEPSEVATAATSSARGTKPRRGLLRGRARGQPGLHISTPGRQPPTTAPRRVSPGLRIESRSVVGELHPSKPASREHSAELKTPPGNTQSTTNVTPTPDRMMSQYTYADSYDDDNTLEHLKANLDDPDLGLQTQVPPAPQTQTQTQTTPSPQAQ